MYEFWYDYTKPKYQKKAKLCYTDTDSFIIHIKTEDFFEDIANDVEKWFDTSNYDENNKSLPPIGKNKKVIGLFKDELGGKCTKEFARLRAKTYAYLMDDNSEHKKAKETKKCIIKIILMFKNYNDCQSNNIIILKSQERFKSHYHNVQTEQINNNTGIRVLMMTKDCKHLIKLQHIHTEQTHSKYAKERC